VDVPRIPSVPPPGGGAPSGGERPPGSPADHPFALGQRLFARVVQAAEAGRVVLEVAGERLLTSTPIPVREGDVLAVVVRGLAPVVELAVEAPPVAFSDQGYALAAIRQALQQAGRPTPLSAAELEVLARALERAGWGSGPSGASPRDRLLALIRPVPLGGDAAVLAAQIQARVASSGTSFEAHAARATAEGRGTAPLESDLRWLLAALGRASAAAPELEPLRQRLVHEAVTRQLDAVLSRVTDGETRVDLPVLFGTFESRARLAVTDDGRPPAPDTRPRGRAIALTVTHPELGPVHAAAQWAPASGLGAGHRGELQVRFAVRDAAAADALAGGVADLRSRLQDAGFRHVGVTVVVDPHAADPAPDRPPDDPPPGGSIVSALA
jgi:flagellar hook-length control protein FliK